MSESEHGGSIPQDEPSAEFDATEAFLSHLKKDDPEGLSDEGAEAPSAAAETAAEGTTEQTASDPDDPEFDVKVDGQTKKVRKSELTRLYGQEASLTQKSQRASELLRQAETDRVVANERLTKLVSNAEAAYKPYADLDMLVLSQRMDTESFAQLRADAALAKSNVDFLKGEHTAVLRDLQQQQQRSYVEASKACVAALENPDTGIKGFNADMYGELGRFAAEQGFQRFNAITDPNAIKLIHMASEFVKMQKAAKAAEAKTAKVVRTPTKVGAPGPATGKADTLDYANSMKELRRVGTQDAATAAFAAHMARET